MTAELHRLSNGIAVAVDPLPGAQSAAIGLYAMVGSRSEPEHLSGLAHVVEHMVFKGAGSRDARAIAEAIEDVGGVLNAWTARDQTVFYGRTLAKDAPLLCELIAELVRSPHMDDAHLEREKVPFTRRRANGQALFQVFFYDPNGIKIELNYDAAEAEGIAAEVTAADLIAGKPA